MPPLTAKLTSGVNFGLLEGYLRSTRSIAQILSLSAEDIVCTWRGRESGEGEMTYGSDHRIEISYSSTDLLSGTMTSAYGTFEFVGQRTDEDAAESMKSMKMGYRRINDKAYAVAVVQDGVNGQIVVGRKGKRKLRIRMAIKPTKKAKKVTNKMKMKAMKMPKKSMKTKE